MTKQHTHMYRRVNIARAGNPDYWVMKCSLCPSYTAMKTKLSAPALRGQIALCNKCHHEFNLDRRALRMASPICINCINHDEVKVDKVRSADNFFKELERTIMEDS